MKRLLTIGLLILAFTGSVAAQGTYADTVRPGESNAKYYVFHTLDSGQFLAALSWDNSGSKLGLVVVCGSSDPEVYGIAGAELDRFARLESGITQGEQCVLAVASANIVAAYRLHVQWSTPVTGLVPRVLSLREIGPAGAGLIDGRLIERAGMALRRTMTVMRH